MWTKLLYWLYRLKTYIQLNSQFLSITVYICLIPTSPKLEYCVQIFCVDIVINIILCFCRIFVVSLGIHRLISNKLAMARKLYRDKRFVRKTDTSYTAVENTRGLLSQRFSLFVENLWTWERMPWVFFFKKCWWPFRCNSFFNVRKKLTSYIVLLSFTSISTICVI